MKTIISWNVNGLRAVHKKGNLNDVFMMNPDILCLQETKSTPDQLQDEILNIPGYQSYFHFPTIKKGYSGVGIYSKMLPVKVSRDMKIEKMDKEGRLIMADYEDGDVKKTDFTLLNCYFPNGGGPAERLHYKLDFYDNFLEFVDKLHEKQSNIVICGDFNVAHRPIDLARPKENENHVGFLPIERAWMDKFISHGWTDIFRHFYPDKAESYTYWDTKTFARERNVGWRIDYFFTSPEMLNRVESIEILDNIFGSDHCPIRLVLK